MYNDLFLKVVDKFIRDYESGTYNPVTEADIQSYLFALCREECFMENLTLNIHVNCRNKNLDPTGRKKLDLCIGNVAVEIKFEADFPGVSKPVVITKEAVKDIDRLLQMRQAGTEHCYFIFLDEDGTHYRNFSKYVSVPCEWKLLNKYNKKAFILFLRI